jgi:hypothetical protein
MYTASLWIDWMFLHDDAYERDRGPASPYIARELGLQVSLRREYQLGTARSSLHSTGLV